MRRIFVFSLMMVFIFSSFAQQKKIRIVFTSDLHFGLKRAHFKNSKDSVSSEEVNRAMIKAIRSLGKIDYLIIAGDIVNREEIPVQSASLSWQQFVKEYTRLRIPTLITPGNHDVSNAIGYYKPMNPLTDKSGLIGIYNIMHPGQYIDSSGFIYNATKFNYSRNIGGIHFQFISIWPDSANRVWMENDLKSVSPNTPVIIFAHDPPEGDPKHFTNPINHGMNSQDRYENVLSQVYNRQYEKEWDDFLKKHDNIKAYFHGHSNYHQYYTYRGLDSILQLPCFRTDSPMKGKFSSQDETLLSFDLVTIDSNKKALQVEQILWNYKKKNKIRRGEIKKISLE